MPRVQLEACVQTVEDAVAAEAGGADRLELCNHLHIDGGWTPARVTTRDVIRAVSVPVVVMVRRQCVRFAHTPHQVEGMVSQIVRYRPLGPAGFVFGALTRDRRIDLETTARLRAACGSGPAIFHRAFDEVADKEAGLEELIRLGFTRVLTSGGVGSVPDHLAALQKLVAQAKGRIQVMPGGGITADTAGRVVQFTRCEHLHGSFSEPHGRGRRTSRDAVAAARAAADATMG